MDPHAVTPPIETLLAERTWLRRLAGALVRDDDLAEDLTQDVYVAALQHDLEGIRSPRRWLGTILRHKALNLIRGARRRRIRDRLGTRTDPVRSVDEVVAGAELAERVGREVLALREPYRSAVLLRYYESEPPRQVAARLQIPLETARTHVRRGLALLRERFAEQEKRSGGDWRLALLPLVRPRVPAGFIGGSSMVKAIVLVSLLIVVPGGLVLGLALWPKGDRADRPHRAASDLHAGQPAAAFDQGDPAPQLRGREHSATRQSVHILETTRARGLDLEQQSLDQVTAYLRTITGLDFVVSNRVRDTVYDDVHVSLHLDDVSVATVLDRATSPHGLVWEVRGGVVSIDAP